MPFEINSFLGKQIEKIRNEKIIENQHILTNLNNLNKELNNLLYGFKHTENINKDYFVIGLFCRIICSFNSIVILQNYGLEADAKTLLRTMIESTFHLRAIVYDNTYFERYLKDADKQTLALINSVKYNPKYFNKEVKQAVSDEKVREIKKIIDGMGKFYTSNLAESAGMMDMYLYTYNLLSLETHSNAKSIISNFFYENNGETHFDMNPKYKDIKFVYLTVVAVVLYVLSGLDDYFDSDYKPIIRRYESLLSKEYATV